MSSFSIGDARAEVFSTRELADAAGATADEVSAWVEASVIRTLPVGDGMTWIAGDEAIRAGRAIRQGTVAAALGTSPPGEESRFAPPPAASREIGGSIALSSTLHAAIIGAIVLATTLGLGQASALSESESVRPEKMRLVYLALPGPGGGGGGGGLKRPTPPPQARREGARSISSPVPETRRPKVIAPPEPPPEEPVVEPEVQAPVETVAADTDTRDGVLEKIDRETPSPGPGADGGTGTGAGSGIGNGTGDGLGEGSGGGTGGGPYRPGSGIEPPALLREIRPDYTEQARRQGIEGEVVMEIVVRADGTVGDVRVLRGLGHGLDEQAESAVRQWRFTPALRRGAPVDVLVEVAMEFRLR